MAAVRFLKLSIRHYARNIDFLGTLGMLALNYLAKNSFFCLTISFAFH